MTPHTLIHGDSVIKTSNEIRLIHGDCMEYMRTLPDNAVDLAIVDPPYAKAGGSVSRTGGTWATKYGTSIQNWDIAPSDEYFKELFRVSRNQIIWGGNYFNLPPTRCFLIWRKLSISENFTMAMAEYAWTSFDGNAKVFDCAPQGKKNDPRIHPTQKPIALYKWILERYAKEGDKILDTHLGSGSSAIAAYDLGFEFTGIEIDDKYFSNALRRFEAHRMQHKLIF